MPIPTATAYPARISVGNNAVDSFAVTFVLVIIRQHRNISGAKHKLYHRYMKAVCTHVQVPDSFVIIGREAPPPGHGAGIVELRIAHLKQSS